MTHTHFKELTDGSLPCWAPLLLWLVITVLGILFYLVKERIFKR